MVGDRNHYGRLKYGRHHFQHWTKNVVISRRDFGIKKSFVLFIIEG